MAEPQPTGQERESLSEALKATKAQKKQADRAVEILMENALPLVGTLVGGPALAGLIQPQIAEQRTFFGVFLSTLAFSLGVAAFVLILQTHALGEITGAAQLGIVAFGCLLAAFWLSTQIGVGMYSVDVEFDAYGSTPVGWIAPFVAAAVATYGVLGMLLGAASGLAARIWGARLVLAAQ